MYKGMMKTAEKCNALNIQMTNMTYIPTTSVFLLLITFSIVEGVCKDNIANCNAYPKGTCTSYVKWSKINCAKSCDVCREGTVDSCDSGWSYSRSDDTCFQIIGMKDSAARKTWYDARSACKAIGGNLVMVKDKTKNDFIQAILSDDSYYWMGIKNVDKTGKILFQYVDGTYMSYTNWKYDQPDNYQNKEHCVVMLSSGQWSDIGCLGKQAFICQKNPAKK